MSSKCEKILSYVNLAKKNFECSICIDYFDDPVQTNCQHFFCKKCIENYIGTKRTQSCPLCKSTINLRMLHEFPALTVFVTKVKNLVEATNKDKIEMNKSKISQNKENLVTEKENKTPLDIQSSTETPLKKRKLTNEEFHSNKKLKSNESAPEIRVEKSNQITPQSSKKLITSVPKETNKNSLVTNEASTSKAVSFADKDINTAHPKPNILSDSTNKLINNNANPKKDANKLTCQEETTSNSDYLKNLSKENQENVLNQISNDTKDMSKLDDPLKFRKETSDISEQYRSRILTDEHLNRIMENGKDSARKSLTKVTPKAKETKIYNFSDELEKKNEIPESISKFIITETIELPINEPIPVEVPDLNTDSAIQVNPVFRIDDTITYDIVIPLKQRKPIQFFKYGKLSKGTEINSEIEAHVCDKKPKNTIDSSTNTLVVTKHETSTQVDQLDICFDQMNYPKLEYEIFNRAYHELESLIISDLLDQYLDTIFKKSDSVSDKAFEQSNHNVSIIPATNATTITTTTVTVINDSLTEPELLNDLESVEKPNTETNISLVAPKNEIISKPKPVNMSKDNFNDLLNCTRADATSKSNKKSLTKKIPTLEFLDFKSGASNPESETNKKPETKPSDPPQVTIIPDTLHTPIMDLDENSESMIVSDTPIKNEFNFERDLENIIIKSASRMEVVNTKALFENSIIKFDVSLDASTLNKTHDNTLPQASKPNNETTILYENNEKSVHEKSTTSNETTNSENKSKSSIIFPSTINDIDESMSKDTSENKSNISNKETFETTLAIENTMPTKTSPEKFTKPNKPPLKKPHFDNQSFMQSNNVMDSLPSNGVLYESYSNELDQTSAVGFNVPPKAQNILGFSLAGDPSLTNISVSEANKTNISFSSSSKSDKANVSKSPEMEPSKNENSITSSELNKIDNLCEDLYTTYNKTVLDDTTSEFVKAKLPPRSLSLENRDKETKGPKLEFVGSLLKPVIKETMKKFAKLTNSNLAEDVTDNTTHLIVDSDQNLICGVTSKYLKAISRKIWIVSYLWMINCLNSNQLLDPSKFEINGDSIFGVHMGPLRARQSQFQLFCSYEFLFIGKFEGISQQEMTDIARKNGAVVVGKAKEFSENSSKIRVLIFEETIKSSLAKMMLDSAKIYSVNKSWLFDSLACYTVRSIQDYSTYESN